METIDVKLFLLTVATERGWTLQPDIKRREAIVSNMAKKARNETVLCPCKVFVEGLIDVADVKCPCSEAPSDIESNGKCHCSMFYKNL